MLLNGDHIVVAVGLLLLLLLLLSFYSWLWRLQTRGAHCNNVGHTIKSYKTGRSAVMLQASAARYV
jgi:hypothetical protein